jgi:coproporphyrinogen III oxidase
MSLSILIHVVNNVIRLTHLVARYVFGAVKNQVEVFWVTTQGELVVRYVFGAVKNQVEVFWVTTQGEVGGSVVLRNVGILPHHFHGVKT